VRQLQVAGEKIGRGKMPAEFEACVKAKGRVRTVSGPSKKHGLKAGEYVNYCFKDGKSFRGETKTKEKK